MLRKHPLLFFFLFTYAISWFLWLPLVLAKQGIISFTWLTNSTRGSILIAAIFQGTMDIAFVSPASPAVANTLGALITIWGIAVLAIKKPQYLSLAGKMVVHQEEDSYRVFMQEARK
jgi:hypothetical protein